MDSLFASRKLLVLTSGQYEGVEISIGAPKSVSGEKICVSVEFSNVSKYNASITGIDEINALANAITYVSTICRESDDPIFYWEIDERVTGNDFL